MNRRFFAGRQLVIEHTTGMLAVNTLTGKCTPWPSFPMHATAYAGSCEDPSNGRSFAMAAIADRDKAVVELRCVDADTGTATAPDPWAIHGTTVNCMDVSGACGAMATNHTVAVIDLHLNEPYVYEAPIPVVALSCWRLGVGCYVGDRHGNVYAVSPGEFRYVGSVPGPLHELHSLADASCIANSATHTAVLFAKTGRCVEFKRN